VLDIRVAEISLQRASVPVWREQQEYVL
jgi:hypothetical protein